jgi:hypothetical protein
MSDVGSNLYQYNNFLLLYDLRIVLILSTFSSVLSTAADCWLVYMDRLITDDLDEGERKVLEKKMETLVDLYYLALDAAKTGMKVNSAFHYTQFLVSTAFM